MIEDAAVGAPRRSGWRRWILGGSLALNGLVVLAVLFVATVGRHVVARLVLEPTRERLASLFAATPVAPGDVVLLGDSLTDGARWSELFPEVPIRNRGIPGDTTADVLTRLDDVIGGRPGRVLLMVGTNDLGQGATPEETAARTREILVRLRRGSPTSRVYVQSVLPRGAGFRDRVEALNRALAAAARDEGATWIDLYDAFLSPDGSIRDDLSNDELHLLGPGYLLWRDRIAPYVTGAAD